MFAADANMIGADGSWDDGSCYLPQEHSAGPFLSTTGMNMMISPGVQGAPAGVNPLSQAPIAQLGGGGAATSQQPQVFYAVPADQYHAMQNNVNSNIVLGNSNMNGGQTGAMIMATAPPGGPSSTTTNGVGSAMGGNNSYAAMERNKWMLRGQEELLDPAEDGAYHYGDVMDRIPLSEDGSLPMDAIESYHSAAATLQLDQQLPATSRPPGGREETPQEYFQFQMMPQCRAGKRKIDRADLLGHSSVLDHQQVQLQHPGMYDAGTNGQKGSSPAPPGLERGGSCAGAKGGDSGGGTTNGGGGFFYTNGKEGYNNIGTSGNAMNGGATAGGVMNDCTGTEKQQLIDFDAAVMGTGGNKGKFGTKNGKCWGKGANKNAQDFFDHGDRYFSNKGGRDAGFGGKGGKGGKYNGSGYGDKDSGYLSDNTAAMSGGSNNCTLTAGGPSNCNPNLGSRSGTSSIPYASQTDARVAPSTFSESGQQEHEQYFSSGKDCDARSQKSGSVSVCKSDGEVEQEQELGGVDLVEFPPLSVNKTSPGKTPEKAKLHKASKSSTAATKSPCKPGSNHTGGDHPGASACGGSLTPAAASVASTKDSVGRRAIPVVLTKKMSMKLAGEASTANDGSGTGTSKSGSQSTRTRPDGDAGPTISAKSTVTSTCADEATTSIVGRAFEDSGSCCSEDMEEPSKPPARQAKQVPQDDQDYSRSNVAAGGIEARCAAVGEDDKKEEAQSALLKAGGMTGVETPDDVWAGRVTSEIVSEPQSQADPGTSASSAVEELDQDTLMSPGSNRRSKDTDPFPSMPIDMRGGGTRSRGSSAAGSNNHGDMIVGAGGSGPRDQYGMNGSATTAAYGGNGGRAGPHQSRYQQDHVGSSQSHAGNQSQSQTNAQSRFPDGGHMNAGQGRFQDGGNSYSYNAAGPNGNRGNSFEGQVHMNNGPMGAARGGGNNDYYAQNRGGGQKGGRVLEQDTALNQQRNNGQGYNNRNNDENGLQCSEIISPNSVCRFWWRGNCVKGKYCEWAHQLPTGCTEKPPPVNRFNTGPAERQWNGRNYPRGPNPANANSGPVVLGNPNPANGPVVANGQMNRGPPPGNSNSGNPNMSTGPAGAGGNSRGAAGPNDGLSNPNPKNMPLCTFWKTGRCENGPGCPWAHPNPGRIHDPCQNVRAAVQDQKALPPPAASQAANVVGRTSVASRAASVEIPSSVAATQNVGAAANPAASPTQNNPQHLQAQAQAEPAERPQSTRDNAVVVDQKNLIGQAEQQQLQRPVAPQQQPILAQRVGGQELQVQPPAQLRAGGPGLVGESTTAQVSVNYKPRDMLVLNEHWDLIICGNRISSFILLIVAVAVGNYMLIWPHSSGAGSSQ